MGKNLNYATSLPGILKLVSLGLVAVTTVLAYYSFFGSDLKFLNDENKKVEIGLPWKEVLLLAVCGIALIGEIGGLIAHLLSQALIWDKRTAYYDFGFHSLCAILLFAGGFLQAISAVEIYDDGCKQEYSCQIYDLKIAAGAFSLLSGALFVAVSAVVLTNRNDVER